MLIHAKTKFKNLTGIGYGLVAFFLMAIYGFITKVATSNASSIWINFFTYLTACFGMFIVYGWNRNFHTLKTERFNYHAARTLFGLAASFLYIFSLSHISLVNATQLFNTAPLFIPFLAIFLLKEKPSQIVIWATFIGFIGVAFIIKPNMQILDDPWSLVGLSAGFSLAIAFTLIKMLSSTEPVNRIIFYFFGLSTLLQIPLLQFAGPLPDFQILLYSCIAGLSFLIAQLFLVHAYELASVSNVSVFQYSTVIFIGLFEWLFHHYIPSLSDATGILLIIMAGIIIVRNR